MIKSYTDIEQSKRLADILPLESADMYYPTEGALPKFGVALSISNNIPCWSLSALLDTFPKGEYKDVDLCFGGYQGDKYIPEWCCSYEQQEPFIIEACYADNPVDACVNMIIKLNELK